MRLLVDVGPKEARKIIFVSKTGIPFFLKVPLVICFLTCLLLACKYGEMLPNNATNEEAPLVIPLLIMLLMPNHWKESDFGTSHVWHGKVRLLAPSLKCFLRMGRPLGGCRGSSKPWGNCFYKRLCVDLCGIFPFVSCHPWSANGWGVSTFYFLK